MTFGLVWKTFLQPLFALAITVPVWVLVAALIYLQVDKASAVRQEINRLVAGAEIAGLEARLSAANTARQLAQDRAAAAERANSQFEADRMAAETENERLADELEDLRSRPAPDGGVVTPDLLRRLR